MEPQPQPRGIKKSKAPKSKDEEVKEEYPVNFRKEKTHYYADVFKTGDKRPQLTSSVYNTKTTVLVSGFSDGSFFLHEMPDFNLIQSIK